MRYQDSRDWASRPDVGSAEDVGQTGRSYTLDALWHRRCCRYQKSYVELAGAERVYLRVYSRVYMY